MLFPNDCFHPILAFLHVLMENTEKLVANVSTPKPKKRSKRSNAAIAKRKQKYRERQLGSLKRDKEILACDLVAKAELLRYQRFAKQANSVNRGNVFCRSSHLGLLQQSS